MEFIPQYIELNKALEANSNLFTAYVLPDVEEKDKEGKFGYVLSYIKDETVYIIDEGLERLGNEHFFRPGMKLEIEFFSDEDKFQIDYQKSLPPTDWISGKAKYGKVDLCYGQSVLVTAPPSKGKTYVAGKILDSYETLGDESTIVYRTLFGERKCDTLGRDTINCDSSATLKYQLYVLMSVLTKSLRSAYLGYNVVVGIDSLTRMVEVLTNEYSHTHMLSGGISASVKSMVSRLFRMSGNLGKGTFTIVGTCLYSKNSNTWKNIYSELSSVATAEFFPEDRSGSLDKTRRGESQDNTRSKNGKKYLEIFKNFLYVEE